MMKRVALFAVLTILILQVHSQDECKDIVYPSDGNEIIFDCCITTVKYGNVVYYKKNGKTAITPAYAINRDGQYLDLKKYKNQLSENEESSLDNGYSYDHDYYSQIFKSATTQRNFGISFVVIGLGLEVWGYILVSDEESTQENIDIGGGLMIAGAILENIGIPLWISGGVKRGNNRRVMEDMERNTSLSLATSKNGIGIVLRF